MLGSLYNEYKIHKGHYSNIQEVINDMQNLSSNYPKLYIWMYWKLKHIVSYPIFKSDEEYRYPAKYHREEVEEIVHFAFFRTLLEFDTRIKTHDIKNVLHLRNRMALTVRYLAQKQINKVIEKCEKVKTFEDNEIEQMRSGNIVSIKFPSKKYSKQIKKQRNPKIQIQLPEKQDFEEDKVLFDCMIEEYLKRCDGVGKTIFSNLLLKADYDFTTNEHSLITDRQIAEIFGVSYSTVRKKKEKVKEGFKVYWIGKKTSQQVG